MFLVKKSACLLLFCCTWHGAGIISTPQQIALLVSKFGSQHFIISTFNVTKYLLESLPYFCQCRYFWDTFIAFLIMSPSACCIATLEWQPSPHAHLGWLQLHLHAFQILLLALSLSISLLHFHLCSSILSIIYFCKMPCRFIAGQNRGNTIPHIACLCGDQSPRLCNRYASHL